MNMQIVLGWAHGQPPVCSLKKGIFEHMTDSGGSRGRGHAPQLAAWQLKF